MATTDDARKIMKVGVWCTSVEEALMNLGLPPNPTEYNPGFLLWETDGKKTLPVAASDTHPIASWCRRSRRASRRRAESSR
jgi:hypothetical protein